MKKIFRVLSIVMVMALALTSISFASLNQVDAKSVVKSLKVKGAKKKLTLKVGKNKTYTVVVKAKKGKTGFTVKSSNKNVVSVKKKGKKITLKALKRGSAKVTVKAKADKKKKYTIKVNVPTVETVTPKVIPQESSKKELVLKSEIILTTGQEYKDYLTPYPEYEGEFKSIQDVPKGLTAEIAKDYYCSAIRVEGAFEEAGKYTMTVMSETKDGKACKYLYIFIVSDENHIIIDCEDVICAACDDDDIKDTGIVPAEVFGGPNGNIRFEILDNPQGILSIEKDVVDNDQIRYSINKTGTYNAKIKVYRESNPNLFEVFNFKIIAKPGIRVTGRMTSKTGKPISGMGIGANSPNYTHGAITDENGYYTIALFKGEYTFLTEVVRGVEKSIKVNVDSKKTVNIIQDKVFVIKINSNIIDPKTFKEWYGVYTNSDGYTGPQLVGKGDTIYVKAGNYSLYTLGQAEIDGQLCSYEATIEANCNNNDATVEAQVTNKGPVQN